MTRRSDNTRDRRRQRPYSFYYSVLNVSPIATDAQIQKSYKLLSRTFHPDKLQQRRLRKRPTEGVSSQHDGDDDATFILIKTAHDVLSDPILRLAYDYGGPKAVYIVKKSLQQRQHRQAQRQGPAPPSENDDDQEESDENLYTAMEQAKSIDQALFLLQEALHEFALQQQQNPQQSLPTFVGDDDDDRKDDDYDASLDPLIQFQASMDAPYSWLPPPPEPYSAINVASESHPVGSSLEREECSWSVQLRRPLASFRRSDTSTQPRATSTKVYGLRRIVEWIQSLIRINLPPLFGSVNIVSANPMTHTGIASNLSTNWGLECQPTPGTQCVLDARFKPSTVLVKEASDKPSMEEDGSTARAKRTPRTTENVYQFQQMSIRTSRQFSSGSSVILAWAGKPMNLQTWSYSIISYRLLDSTDWGCHIPSIRNGTSKTKQTGDKESKNGGESNPKANKVQALWRISLLPTGQLAFLMASLKNLVYPNWRVRFSIMGPYPLKLNYQAAEHDSVACSYSVGWWNMWSRFKVTYIQSLANHWTIQYGIKYDGRYGIPEAIGPDVSGGSLWTLLCHLHSPAWSIRIPVRIGGPTASSLGSTAPVTWMVTILFGQWLDTLLEDWSKSRSSQGDLSQTRLKYHKAQSKERTCLVHHLPFADLWADGSGNDTLSTWHTMIQQIAAKKRQTETLVILRATLSNNEKKSPLGFQGTMVSTDNDSGRRDVTDLVQFWVRNDSLTLPVDAILIFCQQARDPMNESDQSTGSSTVWQWLTSLGRDSQEVLQQRRHRRQDERNGESWTAPMDLTVRYQYQEHVYEISVSSTASEDTLVELDLPNPHATRLGRADEIS